jgi:hypothetical protein
VDLPEPPPLADGASDQPEATLFANAWYRVVQRAGGEIGIRNAGGDLALMSELHLATRLKLAETTLGEAARLHVSHVRPIDGAEEIEIALQAASANVATQVTLVCRKASPAASIRCRTQSACGSDLEILSHSLVCRMGVAPGALYLKNRRELRLFRQKRYWLDRQGARFGTGSGSVLVYHTPDISSLEVDIPSNRLLVHLDDARDHPLIQGNSNGGYRDVSLLSLVPQRLHETSFSVWFGYEPNPMPRLMAVPNGFPTAHVWTEHGCNTDARVQRAVFFGSEKIIRVRDTIGGFAKWKIPVTKSVFFDNPNSVVFDNPNSVPTVDASEAQKGPMPSLRTTEGFQSFVDELAEAGNEICLHCAAPDTSSEPQVAAAVSHMRERYRMRSWIDHLWFKPDGTTQGCLQSFCCHGLRSYSAKLWRDNGVRYFWNPYFEYHYRQDRRSPREALNHWTFDQAFHNPLYWRHPTYNSNADVVGPRTDAYISFASSHAWYPNSASTIYDPGALDSLVDEWGISIAHAYPAFYTAQNSGLDQAPDGSMVISKEFDGLLERMADMQQRGLMLNTTLRELMDYQLALEDLEFRPAPQVTGIEIINNGTRELRGLSLASSTAAVRIDGDTVKGKWHSGSFIFLIDLKPGEKVAIHPGSSEAHDKAAQ